MRHLAYGSSNFPQSSIRETELVVLKGNARVKASGKPIHIPRDCSVSVEADSRTDIAEFSSDVTGRYPLQVAPSFS